MINIKPLSLSDLPKVVIIHERTFQSFFMTRLGSHFLKIYYKSVLKSKNSICLGIFIDNDLHGFCFAATKSQNFNRELVINNLFSFSVIVLQLLFLKPNALLHVMKNMHKRDESNHDNGQYAELFSIAVDRNSQGSGLGKKMLSQLEIELQKRQCKILTLTTDFDNNEKTIAFYKNCGYSIMYEFVTYPNRKMYRMKKELLIVL